MEKVDAKKELNELYKSCPDVTTFVGTTIVPHSKGGTPFHMPFARIIFPTDEPLKPWPKKLVCRGAVEACSGVSLFAIYNPDEGILQPIVAMEWGESCEMFMKTFETVKMFIVELVSPSTKRLAFVVGDEVRDTKEHPLGPGDFEKLQEMYVPPKTQPTS